MPKLKSVELTVDLLPERRVGHHRKRLDADSTEVEAGAEVPVKVFLRPLSRRA